MDMFKAKVLVNCRKNALLQGLIVCSDSHFEILSTSNYMEDITRHIDVYKPDVFLVFTDEFSMDVIKTMTTLKKNREYEELPIIVVAPAESCAEYEAHGRYLFKEIIKRTSYEAIKERIMQIVREMKERKAKEEEERQKAMEEEINKLKKHILVIDDDRNVLKLLKSALEEKYNVTTMLNGKMAEKYLETKTTDLILLDYQMPGETGPEVFIKLRAVEALADIPIVFLTGVSDREKIMQVASLKPQGYLLKPIDMERLYATISELIG